jgi:hypothetical protein
VRQYALVADEITTIAGQFRISLASASDDPLEWPGPGQAWLVREPQPVWVPAGELVFPVSHDGQTASVWVPAAHLLAAIEPGAFLQVTGPIGRKWVPPGNEGRLLIAAQDPGRALPLALQALRQGWSVAWWWRFRLPEWAGAILPPAIEFQTGVPDRDLAEWPDLILIDHPAPDEVAQAWRSAGKLRGAGRVLICHAPLMPCGFGGCQACWVPAGRRRELACVNGPWLPV